MSDEKTDFGNPSLGAWLRDKRLSRRLPANRTLTQALLAKRAGLPRETICSIERGRVPYEQTLVRIMEALGLQKGDLPLEAVTGIWSNPAGDALRKRRKERNLTLQECADASNVSASTLSRFERGLCVCKKLALGKPGKPYAGICNPDYARALGFASKQELGRYLPTRTGRTRTARR